MFVGRSEELGLLEKMYAKKSLSLVLVSVDIKLVKQHFCRSFCRKKQLLILLPAMRYPLSIWRLFAWN